MSANNAEMQTIDHAAALLEYLPGKSKKSKPGWRGQWSLGLALLAWTFVPMRFVFSRLDRQLGITPFRSVIWRLVNALAYTTMGLIFLLCLISIISLALGMVGLFRRHGRLQALLGIVANIFMYLVIVFFL